MFYLNIMLCSIENKENKIQKFVKIYFFKDEIVFITLVTMTLKILFKKMIIVYMCVLIDIDTQYSINMYVHRTKSINLKVDVLSISSDFTKSMDLLSLGSYTILSYTLIK